MDRVTSPSYTLVPPTRKLTVSTKVEVCGGGTYCRILNHLKVTSSYENHDRRRELLLRRQLFQCRDHLLALESGHLQMRLCEHAHHVEDISIYEHTACLFLFLLGDERQGSAFVRIAER